MTDEKKSGLDAIDEGPTASDAATPTGGGTAGDPADHASVQGLMAQFSDAVMRHRVNAGDQHVVWIDAARSHEMLTWLRDDPDQL